MLARCARCQGTFTTDRYGRQTCPHCGSELILPEPGRAEQPPPEPGPPPQQPAPPVPPPAWGGEPPRPPGPPPGGYGPPGGFGPPPPPPGGWGPYPPPPSPGPELPSPFAERRRLGFFAAFFETWKLVATQPHQFFSRVRIDQTGTALLFAAIAVTVGVAAEALYTFLGREQMQLLFERLSAYMSPERLAAAREALRSASPVRYLVQILFAPVFAVVLVYVASAVFHLLLLLFRGASRGFDATVTVVAYALGLALLLVLPVCGSLIAIVWAVVVCIIGLGQAQRCGAGKAAGAVLSPVVLVCVCCCAGFGAMIVPLLQEAQEAVRGSQKINL